MPLQLVLLKGKADNGRGDQPQPSFQETLPMGEFTRVVDAKDLPPGKSTCIEFGAEKVALFNVDGTVYAIADTCTHAGGPL